MGIDRDAFVARVAEALDVDGTLAVDQVLEELDEWDSLGVLAMIELYEEIGAEVGIARIEEARRVEDLVALAMAQLDG